MNFKNTEVWGFEHAFRGARNAFNSWVKNDTFVTSCDECTSKCSSFDKCMNTYSNGLYVHIGDNDMTLAHKLMDSKFECDAKFLRMIHVSVDIDMPRYWWSEADTYHFNSKNSCSTMHKLLNNVNPITKDLFITCEEDNDVLDVVVNRLEALRKEYKSTKDYKLQTRLLVRAKRLLPEGFLQMRTFDTNYSELRNMYFQRRNHRLKEEWIDTFCKWVESLPYAKELITYESIREGE